VTASQPRFPWIAAAGALATVGAVFAQQQIIGGRKLDQNPMVGSGGLNARVNTTSGLTNTRYNSTYNTPQYRNQVNNASGLTRQTYWAQQPNPGSPGYQSHGYQAPSQYASRGPAYDTLSRPLYKPSSSSAQVQVGTSGGYISAYAPPTGVTATRYSPLR
jgi:hypothetical protein